MTLLVLLTVMDYFRMVYNHDLCYHTRSSILYSYATWFNEGRATFLRTPGVQAKLRDILADSTGTPLCDNQAKHVVSEYGHLANPCYPYIRQIQPLQPDDVRVHGCNPNDLALFFSAQETFYRRCVTSQHILYYCTYYSVSFTCTVHCKYYTYCTLYI